MSEITSRVESDVGRTERRAHPRQSVRSLAYVELGEGNGGVALNISEGGMAVRSIMSLMGDELPGVRIRLSHSEGDIRVNARIVWSTDLGTVVGVKFVDLSGEGRGLIREWVSRETTRSPEELATSNREGSLALTSQNAKSPKSRKFAADRSVARISLNEALLRKKETWAAGTAAALLILLILLFLVLRTRPSISSHETENLPVNSDLGLKLDRAGSDWKISWNPNSPVVLQATNGQLLITDGTFNKTVELNSSDLHGGMLVYSPLTDDVVWKLQLTDGSSGPVAESVRTVSAPSSVLTSQNGAGSPQNHARPLSAGLESGGGAKREDRRKYADRLTTTKGSPAPTPTQRVSAQAAASGGMDITNGADPDPALNPRTVATTASEPFVKRLDGELLNRPDLPHKGLFQSAQLLVNVNPSYPLSARQDEIAGTVELRFKIGSDGTVHDISVVRGPNILAEAAVQAVADRKYKPATLDGVPTETEASAVFDFKLN